MTDIQIDAGTLEFSEADGMTATGLLVPFGEECKSNLGKFTAEPDSFTIPSDLTGMSLNVEHEREQVVGGFTAATKTETGIFGSYRFADTDEGRAAYKEAKAGKRKHLSAEVSGVVIRAGKAVAGRLFAAALVERPAFPSATLLAAAEDTSESSYSSSSKNSDGSEWSDESKTTEEIEDLGDGRQRVTRTTVTVTEIKEPDTDPEDKKEDTVSVPTTLNAGAATPAASGLTLHEVGQLLYAARQGQISQASLAEQLAGQNGDTLFGALSDVKYNGVGGLAPTMQLIPQWLGEIKALSTFKQLVLPLFAHGDLTSLALQGFKWTQKPDGGDWGGNKSAVPSNTLTVAPVNGTASPWAVGHDIAREFVDFPVPGFFESYALAVTESYMRWADNKVAAAVIAGATALAADALPTIPGNPVATPTNVGGTIGSTASAIIDGAAVLVGNGVMPSFALVATALWKQMAKMPKSNVLGYLNAALGLDEGSLDGFTIRPSSAVAAGKVLVGAKQAATVYELPGAPIRIDALDLAKGGVDKAAFGYAGVVINDATALQLVTAATA